MLAFNAASISNQEAAMMCQMRGMIGSVDSSTAGKSTAYALVADTLGADTLGAGKSPVGSSVCVVTSQRLVTSAAFISTGLLMWSHQYVTKPLSMSIS